MPASVGTTLRVVRFSSLTPSCASSRRTASLRPDALPPVTRAPSRKPLARATAMNALRSPRSIFTVPKSAQPVRIVSTYDTLGQPLSAVHLAQEVDHDPHQPIRYILTR